MNIKGAVIFGLLLGGLFKACLETAVTLSSRKIIYPFGSHLWNFASASFMSIGLAIKSFIS